MIPKRVILVGLLSFLFAMNLTAMNTVKRYLSGKKYDRVSEIEDIEHINKLLAKRKLTPNAALSLAELCIDYPSVCIERNLFGNVSPSMIMRSGDSFAYELFQRSDTDSRYNEIIFEAFKKDELKLHVDEVGAKTDLALNILLNSDIFVDVVVSHPSFNPNTRYGNRLEPMATILFKAKRYEVLARVMAHHNFANDVTDHKRRRPAFHMLDDNSSEAITLFKTFMGPDLKKWDINNIGIDDKNRLARLMGDFIDNNEHRLLVLRRIIETSLIYHETHGVNKKLADALTAFLAIDKPAGTEIVIDKDFTEKAIKLLVDYKVVKKKREHVCNDYWLSDTEPRLPKVDLEAIVVARERQRISIAEKIECSICLEEVKGDWIKSSPWCEHAFCLGCWEEFLRDTSADKEWVCPAHECDSTIPPSVFATFASANLDKREALATVKKAYEVCFLHHKEQWSRTRNAIPGYRECPKCGDGVVIDTSRQLERTIACHQCEAQFIVAHRQSHDLIPTGDFTNIGRCTRCRSLVDKIDGCKNIQCPVCKRASTWEPLNIE